jgi:hypothetical protein
MLSLLLRIVLEIRIDVGPDPAVVLPHGMDFLLGKAPHHNGKELLLSRLTVPDDSIGLSADF